MDKYIYELRLKKPQGQKNSKEIKIWKNYFKDFPEIQKYNEDYGMWYIKENDIRGIKLKKIKGDKNMLNWWKQFPTKLFFIL